MVLNYRENGTQDLRLGWTIPKFVGNAVLRNRLKRWGREFIREFHNRPSSRDRGFDVNIVLRRRSKEFYKELRRKEFDVALEKAFRRITAA